MGAEYALRKRAECLGPPYRAKREAVGGGALRSPRRVLAGPAGESATADVGERDTLLFFYGITLCMGGSGPSVT